MSAIRQKHDQISWQTNKDAGKRPVTDDPENFFGHLDLEFREERVIFEDDHSRFLIGDWPQ